MDAEHGPVSVGHAIAELAARQGGRVARRQLTSLGVGRGAIERHLSAGRLHHVAGCRGVLAVGHLGGTRLSAFWAAHLAVGPASVISHRSAGVIWDIRASDAALVELLVLGSARTCPRARVHRTRRLSPSDVTLVEGLPVTTVERTLLDLCAVLTERGIELAFDRAEMLHLLDHREVQRVLHEGTRRPGAAKLRAVVARGTAGTTLTTNDLEELMLALVRRAGLADPICQYPVLQYRADFCWPAQRLIVETDGGAHGTRSGRRHDARRDAALQNAGWRVLRFPTIEVLSDPAYVERTLRAALAPT